MVAVAKRTNLLGADSNWAIFGVVVCACSRFAISSDFADLSKYNRLLYLCLYILQSVDGGHNPTACFADKQFKHNLRSLTTLLHALIFNLFFCNCDRSAHNDFINTFAITRLLPNPTHISFDCCIIAFRDVKMLHTLRRYCIF